MHNDAYKKDGTYLNYYDYANDLKSLKTAKPWLKEVDSTSLQSAVRDLDIAFKNFIKHGKGQPHFKSKKTHAFSYTSKCVNGNIVYLEKHIKLPKLGLVKTRNRLKPEGRILSATISQTPSGKYYVSLCCTEVKATPFVKTNTNVGIDLGIRDFAILSSGEKIPNPKYLQHALLKLAKAQRALSRKTKFSVNYNKARLKVARLQEHVAAQRKDYLHKLSTYIVRTYDIIGIEDLTVSNMIKNHKLARNIADVSWSEFTRQLEYKAAWYNKTVIRVNTFYASSQTCSNCGTRHPITKDLKVRRWTCPNCGMELDRDINAAINILNESLRILSERAA
jgi:putative transposase